MAIGAVSIIVAAAATVAHLAAGSTPGIVEPHFHVPGMASPDICVSVIPPTTADLKNCIEKMQILLNGGLRTYKLTGATKAHLLARGIGHIQC